MSAWPKAALGDIFEIARGGSPRPIDDFITDDPTGINWIMIGDATEGSKYITSTKKRILPAGAQRSRQVKLGDFLLTNSMSFGKPYIMRTEGCIHDGWLVLSPRSGDFDADFFYHLLGSKSIYAEFQRRAAGATVKNLNIDLVRGVTVPLPPLEEQRQIAEILDRADALRAMRRATVAQLETLTKSIFLDMFGDPATNPKGWPVNALGNVAETTSGGTPKRDVDDYFGGPIPWVKSGELHQVVVSSTEESLTERGLAESSAKLMPPGTVLVAMYGATVGAVAILGVEAATNQAICCIRPADALTSEYLAHLLRRMAPSLLAKRVGGAQPNLSQELLRNLRIPVPPLTLQIDFGERIAAVSRLGSGLERSAERCNDLCASLQHRAFRGEL
jgi:type I restriction enzyme S subunit